MLVLILYMSEYFDICCFVPLNWGSFLFVVFFHLRPDGAERGESRTP